MPSTYPKFINTIPLGEDLFESGAQKKTASSIAEHIKDQSVAFKLIGLEGSWGVGKSNVISIIKKELGKQYHTFVYDAWSHQEDLQRRSFLEELTADLKNEHIIDNVEWSKKLKDLLAKKKESITKTIPKLSPPILVAILVTLLAPVAKNLSDIIVGCPTLKLLITSLPIITALIVWVIASLINKSYWNPTNLFYLFKEQNLEKTIDEIISEKEPSVREFRNWMKDLSEAVNKDVIVVFDNMDRLPTDKILSLWSAIHTFFSEENYRKIWVIVPFDREHIKEAFNDDQEKANHFINKTFSVIFHVSPAVLTDWKSFFRKKYCEAFGDVKNAEYNTICTIFDLYQDTITPRKIISFINELVSFKLIWKEQIEAKYLAVFVLNKESILRNPIKEILEESYLQRARLIFKGDEAIADNIAALAFNVPLESASQVALYRQIILDIRDRNTKNLEQLAKHPRFTQILEQVTSKEYDLSVDDLTIAVNSIESIVTEEQSELLELIWNSLISKQLGSPVEKQEFSEVHKALLLKARGRQIILLAGYIYRQFVNTDQFNARSFYRAINDMRLFFQSSHIEINFESIVVTVNLKPEEFLLFLEVAEKDYIYFKVNCDNSLLENYLLKDFLKKPPEIELLTLLDDNYAFTKILKEIEKFIKEGVVTTNNINVIFKVYCHLSKERPLKVKLGDSAIHNLLNSAEDGSQVYYELISMRLARGSNFHELGGLSQSVLNLTKDDLAEEIATRIQKYTTYGDLLIQITTWNRPLLLNVCRKLTLKQFDRPLLNILDILENYEKIKNALKVTPDQLLSRLTDWSSDVTRNLTVSNFVEIVSLELVIDSGNIDNDLSTHIIKCAIEYVNNVEPEEWESALNNEGSYEFEILYTLLSSNKINALPNKSRTALQNAFIGMAEDRESSLLDWDVDWLEFYNKGDKVYLKTTIKNIRDIFLNKVDITEKQFKIFESLLRLGGNLGDKANDVLRRIITPVSNDNDCFLLIINNQKFYAMLVNKATEDRFEFIDVLRDKLEKDPQNENIKEFSSTIDALLARKVEINSAKYYTKEASIDVTEEVVTRVLKLKKLHFKIGNDLTNGNDPHKNVKKKLDINYTFDGKVYQKTFEEHDWVRIP